MTAEPRELRQDRAALRRPDTLTSATSSYLREAIIRGDHAPGTRLPETTLARELNVSRGTIREALRALVDPGLVEVIPHRGVVVSALSFRVTWEITSMRALLEPYAAQLALEARGHEDAYLTSVDRAFEDLRLAVESRDKHRVADADIGFHRAIFAPCGHDILLEQLDKLATLTRRLVLMNPLATDDSEATINHHEPIAAAVADGDVSRLVTAIRDHVIEAGELVLGGMLARATVPGAEGVAGAGLGSWPKISA